MLFGKKIVLDCPNGTQKKRMKTILCSKSNEECPHQKYHQNLDIPNQITERGYFMTETAETCPLLKG
ncbi:MAG: hypothetical protein WCG91_00945 [Candidatus Shapirobacteria bacterium]